MSALGCNPQRGDGVVMIGEVEHRVRLTLGALAELEHAFGATDLNALEAALRRASAADMVLVLAALLRGGGGDGGLASAAEPAEAARAIADAFVQAGS